MEHYFCFLYNRHASKAPVIKVNSVQSPMMAKVSALKNVTEQRDRTHREIMFGCFTFAKIGCFVKQFFQFFTTQNLGAVAADLLYKSVAGLCLIFSRAAT